MRQEIERKGTKVLVVGSSGTGKTTFALRYIAGAWHRLVVVYDHEGEMATRLGVSSLYSLVDTGAAMQRELMESSGMAFLAYDPAIEFEGRLEEGFDLFCDTLFSWCDAMPDGTEVLFVVDEIQKVTGNMVIPQPLKTILQTGRRKGLDCLFLSQAPNEIHNTLRNQVTELVSFGMIERNALKFADEMGLDVNEVAALPIGHYIGWNRYTGDRYQHRLFA